MCYKKGTMKGVEHIGYDGRVIAIVFRDNLNVDGIKFFTDRNNPFQVGAHRRLRGTVIAPHLHVIEKPLAVDSIQEILFIKKGKIRLTLYTKDTRKIAQKILKTGDSVLLMDLGHGVELLEDSEIFEVKQGPYPGSKNAKIYLHP